MVPPLSQKSGKALHVSPARDRWPFYVSAAFTNWMRQGKDGLLFLEGAD